MAELVSIVSPCYNAEAYLSRYLDAILAQTYRPLELILVNDGSKDSTQKIIDAYTEKLAAAGIRFSCIQKENQGVGSAINDGLKLTTGDYLIWPDTDDILAPDSIAKRVAFLQAHPEFGFVLSDGQTCLETNLETPTGYIHGIVPKDGRMFSNVISGNVVYTPCGYMIRMEAFLEVNPNKEIYPSRYGQAIQMLLPISRKFRCGHLKEVLYTRVDRVGSLSKKVWTESDLAWKNRVLGLSDIYTETLKSIGEEAIAYIPYIKFRDLRTLSAITKNIGGETRKAQRKTLALARGLLLKEICKSLLDLLKH